MSASTNQVISHWSTRLENFQTSPQKFYQAVAGAIAKRQIPQATTYRMLLSEGSVISPKREYLKIGCRDFYFAVCAAPFGTGFFVSWWLIEPPLGCITELLINIPVIGFIFQLMLVRRMTYYRVDTAIMFQAATHDAILEVIDSITNSQGIRKLTETERKPVMREFFQR